MPDDDALSALTRHATAMATVLAFGRQSGAQQVLVLADQGEDAPPVLLEWREGEPLELTHAGVTWEVPDEIAATEEVRALALARPVPASALHVDADAGVVEGPPGAVAALANAVLGLAEAFGGQSVASADWPTRDDGPAFTIAARPGEPPVLGVGEELFGLPPLPGA